VPNGFEIEAVLDSTSPSSQPSTASDVIAEAHPPASTDQPGNAPTLHQRSGVQ